MTPVDAQETPKLSPGGAQSMWETGSWPPDVPILILRTCDYAALGGKGSLQM